MAARTHYDELHVTRDAPIKVIRAAYRVLSLQHHPDRTSSLDQGERMRRLNAAWSVLSDPNARAAYDIFLAGEVPAATQTTQDPVPRQATAKPKAAVPDPLDGRLPSWLLLAIIVLGLLLVTATLSTKAA